MDIQIVYHPTNIQDFLTAVEAVKGMGVASVVTPSSARDEAVNRYCIAKGLRRYVRQDQSLSALEDLKKRAESGDEIASQALGEQNQNDLLSDLPAPADSAPHTPSAPLF